MNFLTDLVRAFYDLKGLGTELSRRSVGRLFAVIALLSLGSGIAAGLWYADAVTELGVILAEEAKVQAPTLTLSKSGLTTNVKQPYILTEHTLSAQLFSNLGAWLSKRFHVTVPGTEEAMLSWVGGENSRLFCLVIDTTGNYKNEVKPEEYQFFFVADKEGIKFTGESSSGHQSREMKYSEIKAEQPLTIDPNQIRPQIVREKAQGALRIWLSGISFLFNFVRFAISALMFGLFGLLISSMAGKGLGFGRTFAIAVYALVPVVFFEIVRLVALPYPGSILLVMYAVYALVPVLLVRPEGTPAA